MLRAPRVNVVDDVLPRSSTSSRRYRTRSCWCSTTTTWSRVRRSTRGSPPSSSTFRGRSRSSSRAVPSRRSRSPACAPAASSSRSTPSSCASRSRTPTLFLNGLHGLDLDPDDVIRLRELTEGWAAGLYLATLAIRDRASAHEFVEAFAGDHRHVVDYLSSEVLAGLSEETRRFLLDTSVLERLCALRCATPSPADPDRCAMLHDLERSNAFLIPLDTRREWYCYHHLFRELLRHELAVDDPERTRTSTVGPAPGTASTTTTRPRRSTTRLRPATRPTRPS